MATTTKRTRLVRAARSGGLKANRHGLFGPREGKADWTIRQDQKGWLTIERPAEFGPQQLVVAHADWVGPVKLIASADGPAQRIDFYLGSQFTRQFDPVLNPNGEANLERTLSDLLQQATHLFRQDLDTLESWEPPDTRRVVAWLAEAGHTVAIDKDQNLRMTIRASGRDGQVRILCQRGRLRLIMPLGSWSQLESASEAAMLQMADQANAHLRLARIAWRAEARSCCCEAQVDLTGLSWAASGNSASHVIQDMLHMGVDALELALRQLQYELEVLADPKHNDLAQMIFFD